MTPPSPLTLQVTFHSPALMRDESATGLIGSGKLTLLDGQLIIDGHKGRMWLRKLLGTLGFLTAIGALMWMAASAGEEALAVAMSHYVFLGVGFAGMVVGGWMGHRIGGTVLVQVRASREQIRDIQCRLDDELNFFIDTDALRGRLIGRVAPAHHAERDRFAAELASL